MKTYKHYRPRNAFVPLILIGVLDLGALVGLAWSLGRGLEGDPPFPVFLVIFAALSLNLWLLGTVALEIRLEDDGHVELVAPFRRVRIPVLEILSITPSDMMQGKAFVLKHRDGQLRFDPKLTGMHELVSELKARNPSIELRGI